MLVDMIYICFPIWFSPYFPTFLPMTWGSQDISGHHDAPQAQNLGKPNSPAKALRSETCRQICDFGGPGVKLPSGKQTKNYGKSPFFIGKSSISMAIFNSKLLVDQRVQSTPQKKRCRKLYFQNGSSILFPPWFPVYRWCPLVNEHRPWENTLW